MLNILIKDGDSCSRSAPKLPAASPGAAPADVAAQGQGAPAVRRGGATFSRGPNRERGETESQKPLKASVQGAIHQWKRIERCSHPVVKEG